MKGQLVAARSRFLPSVKNFQPFPFFNMRVSEMKAWQLYVGQSSFVLVMGIVFYIIMEVIRMLGFGENKYVKTAAQGLQSLATGSVDSGSGASFMSGMLK